VRTFHVQLQSNLIITMMILAGRSLAEHLIHVDFDNSMLGVFLVKRFINCIAAIFSPEIGDEARVQRKHVVIQRLQVVSKASYL